jgi:hypothetical protein
LKGLMRSISNARGARSSSHTSGVYLALLFAIWLMVSNFPCALKATSKNTCSHVHRSLQLSQYWEFDSVIPGPFPTFNLDVISALALDFFGLNTGWELETYDHE